MSNLKPPLKICGGKTKLLSILDSYLPPDFANKKWTYDEPFLGGGAFMLHLLEKYPKNLVKVIGNELNVHVCSVWDNIIHQCPELVTALDRVSQIDYSENYYSTRIWFNEHCEEGSVESSAYFMYLNHTCFNGLIRFNSRGEFNSPIGSYTNPKIFDRENISNLHQALKDKVELRCEDFQDHIQGMFKNKKFTKNTFVYLDPPYIPRSLTSSFTSYTPDGFGLYDHKRLKLILDLLDSKGVKFMLSNSHTPLTFETYRGYSVVELESKRSIAAKSDSRKAVKEVLIKNYE
jgi:DNA adenine methylase